MWGRVQPGQGTSKALIRPRAWIIKRLSNQALPANGRSTGRDCRKRHAHIHAEYAPKPHLLLTKFQTWQCCPKSVLCRPAASMWLLGSAAWPLVPHQANHTNLPRTAYCKAMGHRLPEENEKSIFRPQLMPTSSNSATSTPSSQTATGTWRTCAWNMCAWHSLGLGSPMYQSSSLISTHYEVSTLWNGFPIRSKASLSYLQCQEPLHLRDKFMSRQGIGAVKGEPTLYPSFSWLGQTWPVHLQTLWTRAATFHTNLNNVSESGGTSNMRHSHFTDQEFETQRIWCLGQRDLAYPLPLLWVQRATSSSKPFLRKGDLVYATTKIVASRS